MAVEQGKWGLWYSKGTGFATKEQAEAHEDGTDRPIVRLSPVGAKKGPSIWPGIIVAVVILISVVVIAVKSMSNSESPSKKAAADAAMQEIKLQRLAREFVSTQLKDPDSADFRHQRGMCGEVNAKNSFGGYAGFKRFIAANAEMVFLEDDKRLEAGAFQAAWDKFCV